jgi:gluconate 2-dehydrogenase alpha chain
LSIPTEETEVIIVGLGAAGGIAVYPLTQAGIRIVALEAGPWRRNEEFPPDELTSWQFRNTLGPKFNREWPTWRESAGAPTVPAPASLGKMMNGVGGSTVHYGAWSRRFLPDDFRAHTSTLERYGEEAVPEDSTLADWPLSYDELEPYYDKVEKAIGVSGLACRVDGKPPRREGNPFEGRRSDEYPLPPLRDFAGGELFSAGAESLGYHPYKVPAAVTSREYDGRSACTYCGWNSGYGCRFGAKSSTLVSTIPKALESGLLDIRPLTRVTRVLTEGEKAVGVEYVIATGERRRLRGQLVILAAYTYEIVRLLLLSGSETFPKGLANSTGQVGKHFMTHQYLEVAGLFPGHAMNRFAGATPQAVCFDDLNADNFDHTGLGFIRGGTVGLENSLQPIGAANIVPPTLPVESGVEAFPIPRWGRAYKEFLLENWNSVTFLRAQPEPLSYHGNELDLDPVAREGGPLNLPRVRVTYSVRENERKMSAFLLERMEELMRSMGAKQIYRGPAFTGILSSHDVGGVRMGEDPDSSVVDRFGRAHQVEGLVVMSGATFPTCTGSNPTETIQALSWYASDQIVRELRPREATREEAEPLVGSSSRNGS